MLHLSPTFSFKTETYPVLITDTSEPYRSAKPSRAVLHNGERTLCLEQLADVVRSSRERISLGDPRALETAPTGPKLLFRAPVVMLTLYHPQATSIRSIKSLVPLLDRVLVQRIKAEAKTAGGIYLPESSVKELNEAKVLAVGPGALDKDGKRVPMGVAAGDRVLIPQVCCHRRRFSCPERM